MKKIDKLILSSFLGPFFVTFLVVVFILLMQNMLKYFDDIIGKDLGWDVIALLFFYFAVFMVPFAMPLAVLLSSLITYGNLGEHFELTAVKSLGISLTRSLVPIGVFVVLLVGVAFYANNYLVPKAALEAYSLIYDIKQKKPALDLREGAFYNGIPDISIKVNKKYRDGISLKDVIIYDHRGRLGNKEVIIADSGRMFTMHGDQYLKLELFNGYNYSEGTSSNDINMVGQNYNEETLRKTAFARSEMIFDLSSFNLNRTEKKWFQGNRIMRNLGELQRDMDSVSWQMNDQRLGVYQIGQSMFSYHLKRDTVPLSADLRFFRRQKDSLFRARAAREQAANDPIYPVAVVDSLTPPATTQQAQPETRLLSASIKNLTVPGGETSPSTDPVNPAILDSIFGAPFSRDLHTQALNNIRVVKSQMASSLSVAESQDHEYLVFQIQWHKILSSSVACFVMFLIGAPLGAIIKKGGLGIPVIVSIFFFIIYYVMGITGEKWAKQHLVSVPVGVWMANVILLIIGLLFLRQARVDARLFDSDFYLVVWDRLKRAYGRKRLPAA
ncbi:MAG: LptF/LptG family permease [Cyclobacteriaceae bacterium]|nr:LptF/LptG family permease [Cyclobacteriaceae bacterium]